MIRPKPRRNRTNAPWRPRKIRLDAKGMAELRHEAFARANARCEKIKPDGITCMAPISWWSFQLHHVIKRSQGGSDELENVLCLCRRCHAREHPGPIWTGRKFA